MVGRRGVDGRAAIGAAQERGQLIEFVEGIGQHKRADFFGMADGIAQAQVAAQRVADEDRRFGKLQRVHPLDKVFVDPLGFVGARIEFGTLAVAEQVERVTVITRRVQFGQEVVPIAQGGRQPVDENDGGRGKSSMKITKRGTKCGGNLRLQ